MALSAARGAGLAGFVPYRIDWRADPHAALWCHVGARRFEEPFFEETLERALGDPFSLVFQHRTPLDALADFAPPAFGPEPAGLVFHLSRCGSTLVSQMLAQLPSSVVLSEPAVLDSLLRHAPALGEARAIALLRGLVGALGRPRAGAAGPLVLKLDSWHVHALPLLRRAFPDVPWIFLMRDPLEVLVSHRRRRGAQMIPGMVFPTAAPLDVASAASMEPEAYAARVLAHFCDAARAALALGGGRLVHYDELPDAVPTSIAAHFGLSFTDAERACMGVVAGRDAKDPTREFVADGEAKRAEASARERELCDAIARPAYAALEALRRAQPAPATRAARSSGSSSPAGAG